LGGLEQSIRLNPWVLIHANLLDALATSLGVAFTPFVLMTTVPDAWTSRTRLSFKLIPLENGATIHGNVFIDLSLPSPGPQREQEIKNENFDLLPFFFHHYLGYRSIATTDYRRLTLYCGIIIKSYEASDSTQVWYGNGLQIRLKPSSDQTFSLLSIINLNPPVHSGVDPLNAFHPDTPASNLLDLDELPVTLTFVSAELILTLQQLRRLQPGSPIELPVQAATDQVSILANGVQVGRGQLLRVGESLVVQVTQMAGFPHV
jgi:flagellar motor switch/type III secretory pathway protein FliN